MSRTYEYIKENDPDFLDNQNELELSFYDLDLMIANAQQEQQIIDEYEED